MRAADLPALRVGVRRGSRVDVSMAIVTFRFTAGRDRRAKRAGGGMKHHAC